MTMPQTVVKKQARPAGTTARAAAAATSAVNRLDAVDELLRMVSRAPARDHAALPRTKSKRAPAQRKPTPRTPSGRSGIKAPPVETTFARIVRRIRTGCFVAALLGAVGVGGYAGSHLYDLYDRQRAQVAQTVAINMIVDRIIRAESSGDPNAKNKRSTASGAGQFVDGTWLDMIRAYRPDLSGRPEQEVLDLRFNPDLAREMTIRFAERNAAMLSSRGLPVTPGTLYLSHFAGGAGAVAVLTAPETTDAASVMAKADSTGRTTREKIVKANPFLETFTIADLKNWGDRKMRPSDALRHAPSPHRK